MKRLILFLAVSFSTHAAPPQRQWQITDERLMAYFERTTRELSEKCLTDVVTKEDWNERAPRMREQLAEMFGLAPMPPRTDLKATVTKRFEHDTFTVENLHFQSMPGLYVTANLYLPKNVTRPVPTVLYVCGHGPVITNGVSYGNKVTYQHHGAWFARNGYACLLIDTLQLGEIQGLHHGTHREELWWWNSRGYSPAGVEAWNSVRALDYLSTRPEVDTNRFGITGRSGGGAYSWFAAALDDRIKAVAPVAGITDLQNHVVDGATEGHCDCMFFVNTYRWDYPQLAALVAPRPLLLCNTDSDYIFPLDGVVRTHSKVRRIYELLGAGEKLGLVITPGPHKDTQELQLPVMRWFNRHLKGEEVPVESAAVKLFAPQQLRVFEQLPSDAVNTNLHFTFVKAARATVPATRDDWGRQRQAWLAALREKSFAAWPKDMPPAVLAQTAGDTSGNKTRKYFETASESDVKVRFVFDSISGQPPEGLTLRIPKMLGGADFQPGRIIAQLEARSAGEKVYADRKKLTQIRRRHMLLGTTVDAMRVWDIVRGIEAIRASEKFGSLPLRIEAEGDAAVNALYASLFAPVEELVLQDLPASHMAGPDYLNVLRILDIPQALAMASERSVVQLQGSQGENWSYALETAKKLGWDRNLRVTAASGAP